MTKEKISPRILTITAVGICAALLTVCSWISTPPIGPMVQFTLQTFAIFLISGLFPLKISLTSIAVYITLGMVGLPVFSNFKSGIAAVTGPTGGYIVGFVFAAIAIDIIKRIKPKSTAFLVLAMTVGLALCYAFGTMWFYIVFARTGEAKSVLTILSLCVFPFIIPDALKMAAAVILVKRLSLPLSKLGFTGAPAE